MTTGRAERTLNFDGEEGGGAYKRGAKALTHGRGSVDICEIIILSIFCLKLWGGGGGGRGWVVGAQEPSFTGSVIPGLV